MDLISFIFLLLYNMKTFQNKFAAIDAVKYLREGLPQKYAPTMFNELVDDYDYYDQAVDKLWYETEEWLSDYIRYNADNLYHVKNMIEDIDLDDDCWIIDNNWRARNIDESDVQTLVDYIIDDIMDERDITEEDVTNAIDYYWDDANYIHLKFWHMWKMYNFTDDFIKDYPDFYENYRHYFNWDKEWRWHEWDEIKICEYIRDNDIPVHLYNNFEDVPYTINDALEYFWAYGKEEDN